MLYIVYEKLNQPTVKPRHAKLPSVCQQLSGGGEPSLNLKQTKSSCFQGVYSYCCTRLQNQPIFLLDHPRQPAPTEQKKIRYTKFACLAYCSMVVPRTRRSVVSCSSSCCTLTPHTSAAQPTNHPPTRETKRLNFALIGILHAKLESSITVNVSVAQSVKRLRFAL